MNIEKIKDALKVFSCEVISQNENEAVIKVSKKTVKLADIPNGSTFKVGKFEFIKLGDAADGETTAVILKKFVKKMEFGKHNNYAKSDVRKYLNSDFLKELEKEVGANNIYEHKVDLTANDGLKDYGSVRDKVSLITAENYRRYREFLPGYGDWWWTATPYSCESNGYTSDVCCVYDNGALDWDGCDYSWGVRPFCIFSSSIFVSCE